MKNVFRDSKIEKNESKGSRSSLVYLLDLSINLLKFGHKLFGFTTSKTIFNTTLDSRQ